MYSLSHKHKLSTFSSYSVTMDYMFFSICNIFQYSFWRHLSAFKAGLSFLIEIYTFPFCHHLLNRYFTDVPHFHECSHLASVKGGESSFLWILMVVILSENFQKRACLTVMKEMDIFENIVRFDIPWLANIHEMPACIWRQTMEEEWREGGRGVLGRTEGGETLIEM